MTRRKLQRGGPRKAVPPEVKAEAVRRALAQLREENERRHLEATCWKPPTREEIERKKQEERQRVKAALRSWNPLRKLREERGVIHHKED